MQRIVHSLGSLLLAALVAIPASALAGAQEAAPVVQVSESGAGAYEASLASLGTGFAAAWHDNRDGNSEIYFRLLDAVGRPQGPEHRVTENEELSYEADIVAVGPNLALAWYEVDGDRQESKLALWTPEGKELWRRTISGPDRNGRIPVIRAYRDRIFSAWLEDNQGKNFELWGRWWTSEGEPINEPYRLSRAGPTTWNLNAKIDDSGWTWVVWDAAIDTQAEELYLVPVNSEGIPGEVVRLTSDDGFRSKYPDLALANGQIAVTWFDEKDGNPELYLYVGSRNGVAQSFETSAARITDTPGDSIGGYLEWNGQTLALAWNDNTVGQQELYFQPFDSEGRPSEAALRLTETEAESLIPAIRPWKNGFAIAWNEYSPSPDGLHGSQDARSEIFVRLLPE